MQAGSQGAGEAKAVRVTHHTERVTFPRDGKKAKAYFKTLQERYTRCWCVNRVQDAYQSELRYYKDRYSAMAEARNEACAKARHKGRILSAQDMHGRQNTCPEELSIQAGRKNGGGIPGRDVFEGCVMGYLSWMRKWNRENGDHLHVLGAYVSREAPYRAIIRRVWDYTGNDGLLKISMTGALKKAGIPYPYREAEESRYNNRKMTFDRISREALYQCFEGAGIPVNREPGIYTLRQALKLKEDADAEEQGARDILRQITETEEEASHLDGTEGVMEEADGSVLVPEQGYLLLKIREGLGGAYGSELERAERDLLDALEDEMEAGRLCAMQEGIRQERELEYAALRAGLLRCGYYAGDGKEAEA